jgi:hypothetical protein
MRELRFRNSFFVIAFLNVLLLFLDHSPRILPSNIFPKYADNQDGPDSNKSSGHDGDGLGWFLFHCKGTKYFPRIQILGG